MQPRYVLFHLDERSNTGWFWPKAEQRPLSRAEKDASAALRRLVKGKPVICYLDGTTARKRPVGVCHVAGVDVGEVMVREGYARDCPRYSGGRYANAEKAAVRDGRNLSAIYPLPRYC